MGNTKEFKDLNLIDNFLINAVAQNVEFGENFCRMLLTVLLQRKLGKIHIVSQSELQGVTPDKRGIRLDVEVREIEESSASGSTGVKTAGQKMVILRREEQKKGKISPETEKSGDNTEQAVKVIYDVEPHRRLYGENLPRRNRFSQAKIDARSLRSGERDFGNLPDLYVISILDYDPFGYDYMIYTIHNKCEEVDGIEYEDGLHFLYFYTKGAKGGTKEIKELLEFIQNSREEKAVNATLEKMYQYVERVKTDPGQEEAYMMFDEYVWYKQRETAAEVAAETVLTNTRENIFALLEDLGEVPGDIREKIENQQDIEVLRKWLKTAPKMRGYDAFRKEIGMTDRIEV